MTCNSDQDGYSYRDENDRDITRRNIPNHCNDISIYTTQGFEDIDLKCNDDSSLCAISGSIYCTHLDDECTSFTYHEEDDRYQCENNNFCVTSPPSLAPTPTIALEDDAPLPSSRPTNINPRVPEQEEQGNNMSLEVQTTKEEEDIDTLYVVIIGTLAILCIVLSIAGVCGFCYVRLSRESVEETIVKRYIADRGRGASINNELPSYYGHTTTMTTTTDANGEDDLGSKESKVGSSNGDGIIYGDAGSDNISSFDDDALNKILDMDLNGSPNGTDESSLGLGLTATFPIGQSSQSHEEKQMKSKSKKKMNISLGILKNKKKGGNKNKNKNKNQNNHKLPTEGDMNATSSMEMECDIDKYDDINMFEDELDNVHQNKNKNIDKLPPTEGDMNATSSMEMECDIDKYDDINMFEDELDNVQNSLTDDMIININDNMTSNPLNNIHRLQQLTNTHIKAHDVNSSMSLNNNSSHSHHSHHSHTNSNSGSSQSHTQSHVHTPSNSQDGHDSFSTSTYVGDGDSEDTFDFEQEELKIEREMGLISAASSHPQHQQQYHHEHAQGSGCVNIEHILSGSSGVIYYGNPHEMNMNTTSSTPVSHSDEYKIVYTDNIGVLPMDCDCDHENTTEPQQQDCVKCNLPAPPPAKKLQLYLQSDLPLTDKQKEIQLENIKNRAKCYGYQQPQILFEDDENFSDDSDNSNASKSDHNKRKRQVLHDQVSKANTNTNSANSVHSPSKKLKLNLANNDSNSKYLKVITQTLKQQRDQSMTMTMTQTRTRDRSLSNSRSMGQRKAPSITDDMLDDGKIIQIIDEQKSFDEKLEIKIHFPEEDDNDDMDNDEHMTPITPCSSDRRDQIHQTAVRDPEILSDDEELPTLPANSPSPDSHSNHNKTTFGHTLNVNVNNGW
eukprot:CAMPEP_0201594402 /NCGR_PEP_ID=MMETSP0190_2-20130828/191733_1 /ASSEMBLY_ACC=CAM_ASM_000263 /TAXON_ID=37353 /ORGANISM="Rosalina sp." /LENGTH=898 /DNA_ID=CAMNT_0048054007 /DNA_START=344 /DNA_END=3037 /DNA_ORIENTATION=-